MPNSKVTRNLSELA
jgi:hypothetical protein